MLVQMRKHLLKRWVGGGVVKLISNNSKIELLSVAIGNSLCRQVKTKSSLHICDGQGVKKCQ